MTSILILNLALAAAAFAVILSLMGWAIATSSRDAEALRRYTPRRRVQRTPRGGASHTRARGQVWLES